MIEMLVESRYGCVKNKRKEVQEFIYIYTIFLFYKVKLFFKQKWFFARDTMKEPCHNKMIHKKLFFSVVELRRSIEHERPIFAACFLAVLSSAMITYFLASLMDPGYVYVKSSNVDVEGGFDCQTGVRQSEICITILCRAFVTLQYLLSENEWFFYKVGSCRGFPFHPVGLK